MADPARFARRADVLWRLAPDRVVVRRVWPHEGADGAADLLGLAAEVWIVLDEPASTDEVCARLAEWGTPHSVVDVVHALDDLTRTGWVHQH